ncbi:MAG: hypothetical protein ACO4AC_10765 [Pseudohongiellaceae bacterium]
MIDILSSVISFVAHHIKEAGGAAEEPTIVITVGETSITSKTSLLLEGRG